MSSADLTFHIEKSAGLKDQATFCLKKIAEILNSSSYEFFGRDSWMICTNKENEREREIACKADERCKSSLKCDSKPACEKEHLIL